MGFVNRFKSLFSSKSEPLDEQPVEFHDPHQEKMAEAFVERQQGVIDDAMNELESIDEKIKSEPDPTPASDYDAGDVEMQELLSEDVKSEDHSEMNVIEHFSLEEMGDHLESATIEGDLPEEVKFE
ncbi:MAG: hypothetical protein CMA72_01120 [Euryarchaeota archaeon]|nr:hypothetical protein [Euryarchaeota archaeon]|tara:strand:+ start:514 stop:891 length:378 start_codon:yes stop_codon:yes gene_type:complete